MTESHSSMRILHVVPTLDPSRGGPSRSVLGLSEAQAACGQDVRIVTGTRGPACEVDAELVKVETGPLMPMPFSIPGRRLSQSLWSAIREADVVHLHSVWNGTTTRAGQICRRLTKPIVLSPRGMLDRHNMQRRARFKSIYLRGFERANLEAIAGFHFLDDTEYEGCEWLASVKQVPHVIQPNGLDLINLSSRLVHLPVGLVKASVPDDQAQHLVFLGRLNVIKGLELQVELLADLIATGRNVHLHLIGPDDGEGASITQLATQLGVAANIHQHGPMYGDDRLRWLQEADAVLLTSHYECNSNAAAETLAVGGVLVASETCHLDRAASANAARVVPRDRGRLLAELVEVLSNSEASSDLRSHALSFSRSRLDWKPLAEQMINFYRMLLQRPESCAG